MFRKKISWISLIVLVLLAGAGYVYYTTVYLPGHRLSAPTIKTAQVSRGDLVVSVSGSGTLIPAAEIELGFESGNYVDDVLVEVGDHVRKGDLLARPEIDDLTLAVAEADIKARQAELDLAKAKEGPTDAELANAEAAVQSAQTQVATAQYTYDAAQNSDLDAAVRANLIHFQVAADRFYALKNGDHVSQERLNNAWNDWASTEYNLNVTQRQVQMELLDVSNQVEQAQNRNYQAQENLVSLQSGPNEESILRAQLKADQAALALENARADLAAAQLRAPFDGVVAQVMAIPGQHVGSAPFITLANLEQPLLQFWVEEEDMSGVGVGDRVSISFEALPDDTFSGEVLRVDPALVTVGGTQAVQALASVDPASNSASLFGGMNADVEVISAESGDTLLVPLQALRELSPGQYAVFIVQADGEMVLRPVTVGLKDFVNAEVNSGLALGEVVSIGVETSSEAGAPSLPSNGMPFGGAGGPGTRMLEGGGR